MKQGLVLLNLGTPAKPDSESVGAYLREFLMDPLVIDTVYPLRWILVNLLIVPKRKKTSSEQYQTIWSERGSPLLYHLSDLKEAVQSARKSAIANFGSAFADDMTITTAMRYGKPSIESAFMELFGAGVTDILVFPLYPQYAESSTLSCIHACQSVAKKISSAIKLKFVPPFYDHIAFIRPYAEIIKKKYTTERPDHLLMSFHSLPERHIHRTDHSAGKNCLMVAQCCSEMNEGNRDCYRAQCYSTARELAKACGLSEKDYSVAFQSRLGKSEWIKPATEATIAALGKKGVKRLAVVCPSFVADCLETVEEIGVRAAAVFRDAGGEDLIRIACLNSDSLWAAGVAEIAQEHLKMSN